VIAVGANWFQTYHDGADVRAAFDDAVREAEWEHGHGGYSGTIAEKRDYVIITGRPVSRDEATRLADDLVERDDPRVADKWGPAGAIPITRATAPNDHSQPEGWLFCGWASS
jgi:hypothetical protein